MFVSKFTVTVFKQTCYSIFNKRLVSSEVRVRFAPSPTGFLHLGGLRTALFNHLFAKSQNGTTILRIEDTDLSRTVPLAAENLIEDLAWLGITFDEGPYFQSERKEIYEKYAKQLVEQGDAYYCFCSNVRLNLLRKEAFKVGEIPKYDNSCRHLTKEEVESNLKTKPACIRFKLTDFTETIDDLVLGSVNSVNASANEGDFVILKTDGFPTYHLANIVDDHLMKISHVLRGVEWLGSMSKHLLLYRAFKWNPPRFGHLPLLLNEDGTKLSKRHGHFHVRNIRESGYFPNSVINFIARVGGGFNITTEKKLKIYTLDELSEKFELSSIKLSSGKVNIDLLPSYNHAEFLRQFNSPSERKAVVKKIQEMVQKHYQNRKCKNSLLLEDKRIENILEVIKNRILRLEDLIHEDYEFLWNWEVKLTETNEAFNEIVKSLIVKIEDVNWSLEDIKTFLNDFCKSFKELKYSDIMQKLRLALSGKKVGLSVAEIMSILSKEEVQFRLLQVIQSKSRGDVSQN